MKKSSKRITNISREHLLLVAILITGAMGVYAGNMLTHADYVPVQRIHANQGNGYSFDIILPPKGQGKQAKKEPVTVAIEGDSMSAITEESLYNINRGSAMEVWWLRLDPKLKLKFFAFAQGKSGYKKQGEIYPRSHPNDTRSGTNFQQRLQIPQIADAVTKADMMWIAGGFNDASLKMNRTEFEKVVAAYMDNVSALRTKGGHSPRTVLVTDLWAEGANRLGYKRIVPVIKKQAKKHGFTFIEERGTFSSNKADTTDGIHYKGRAGDRIASRFEKEAHLKRVVNNLREGKSH